jgi:hypothetical protein
MKEMVHLSNNKPHRSRVQELEVLENYKKVKLKYQLPFHTQANGKTCFSLSLLQHLLVLDKIDQVKTMASRGEETNQIVVKEDRVSS